MKSVLELTSCVYSMKYRIPVNSCLMVLNRKDLLLSSLGYVYWRKHALRETRTTMSTIIAIEVEKTQIDLLKRDHETQKHQEY